MKKIITNSVLGFLCFSLWFLPISSPSSYAPYVSSINFLFACFAEGIIFWREILIVILGMITVALSITDIIKKTKLSVLLLTISTSIYIVLWLLVIFVPISSTRSSILQCCEYGLSKLWIGLYIIILIAIIVLLALQYIQHLASRRPTKAERLQSQIDELQKQVDELKKGD